MAERIFPILRQKYISLILPFHTPILNIPVSLTFCDIVQSELCSKGPKDLAE